MKLLIFILFFSFSSYAYGISLADGSIEATMLPSECFPRYGGELTETAEGEVVCSVKRRKLCESKGGKWGVYQNSGPQFDCYQNGKHIHIPSLNNLKENNPRASTIHPETPPADNNPSARGPLELFKICKEKPNSEDCARAKSELDKLCKEKPNSEDCAPWLEWETSVGPPSNDPTKKCDEDEVLKKDPVQGDTCISKKEQEDRERRLAEAGNEDPNNKPANNKPANNKEENQVSCNDLNFQKDCNVRSTASFKDLLVQGVTAALSFGENACASAALQALNQEQPYASTIASCQSGSNICKTNSCDNKLCQAYENQVIKLKDDKMKLKAAYMQSVTCYNQVRAEKPAGKPLFCQIITALNSADCCHLAEHKNNSICQHVHNFADYNANDPKGNYEEAMEGIELTETELPPVRFPEPNQKNQPSVNYASPSSGSGGGGAMGGGSGGDPYTGGDNALPINARNSKFKPYMGAGGNKWGNKKSRSKSYPMLTSVQRKMRDLKNNKNKKYANMNFNERKIAMKNERTIFERIRDAYAKLYNKGLLTENLKKSE